MKHNDINEDVILLKREQGRKYVLGGMTAIFKVDGNETDNKYGVAEWWLNPNSEGTLEKTLFPGAHTHESKVEIFYVFEGTISFLLGDKWTNAEEGTFIRIPVNTMHTFANRTDKKTGFLNFYIPGGFERGMPEKVEWFKNNK